MCSRTGFSLSGLGSDSRRKTDRLKPVLLEARKQLQGVVTIDGLLDLGRDLIVVPAVGRRSDGAIGKIAAP